MAVRREPHEAPAAPLLAVTPLAVTPLAVTMGDPAGIGPEIILKSLGRTQHARAPSLRRLRRCGRLRRARPRLVPRRPCQDDSDAARSGRDLFRVLSPSSPCPSPRRRSRASPTHATPPRPSPRSRRRSARCIAAKSRGLVTGPIAKSVLYAGGFSHPGHTEFLAALAERHWPGRHWHPVMMIASEALRVVPLTIHVPLKDVPQLITRALIERTVRITWEALENPIRHRASAHRDSRASIPMPAKTARSAARTSRSSRRQSAACARKASR